MPDTRKHRTESFLPQAAADGADVQAPSAIETDRSRFAELVRFRILLEKEAIRHSIAWGDLEWEGRVVTALQRLTRFEERMVERGDGRFADWVAHDYGFHYAIMSACGSKLHLRSHRAVFDQIRRHLLIEFNTYGFRGEDLVLEHRAIGNAALERDAGLCVELLTRHLDFYFNKCEDRPGGI